MSLNPHSSLCFADEQAVETAKNKRLRQLTPQKRDHEIEHAESAYLISRFNSVLFIRPPLFAREILFLFQLCPFLSN